MSILTAQEQSTKPILPVLTAQEQSAKRLIEMLATALGASVGSLLNDLEVEEIRVNPDGRVWYDKGGMAHLTDHVATVDDRMRVIQLVANHKGTVVNSESPSFPAELPETGYRFHAVIPPQSPEGPLFVIRRKPVRVFTLEQYVEQGIMTARQSELLKRLIEEKKTIIASGPTRSGKTTLANAILREVGKHHHRVVVIEDTRELIVHANEVIYLRTVKDGEREIRSMRHLLMDTLRLSPWVIVIGEVRGLEVVDMLDAWNTGHQGGVGTLHANTAREVLTRIEQLIKQANAVPIPQIIANAVNIIVQMGFVKLSPFAISNSPLKTISRGLKTQAKKT